MAGMHRLGQGSANVNKEEDFRFVVQGDRWKCVNCGACCRNLFSENWLNFILNRGLLVSDDATCPFLSGDNRCRIYRDRFNPCKGFPFTLRKAGELGTYGLVIHKGCAGFGKGGVIDVPARIGLMVGLANVEFGHNNDVKSIHMSGNQYLVALSF